MKNEFYFPSKDGNTEIHTIEWKPEGEVKAILQICHGMLEHIDRYDEFARYLCDHGFYVVGNDHLGHGKSVQCKSDYGFFHEEHGNAYLLGDIHALRQRCMEKYPGVPYFILGHSLGTSLLRQYIATFGKGLSGVLLTGTAAEQNPLMLKLGKRMCQMIAVCKDWHYRSKFIDSLAFGSFNKKCKCPQTRADWISSDIGKLCEYLVDPLCSFMLTVNGYHQIFEGMLILREKSCYEKVPRKLPILMASGSDDPVGDYGKGVRKIFEKYKNIGVTDIALKIYEGHRHEILNEKNRRQVYQDICEWMQSKI